MSGWVDPRPNDFSVEGLRARFKSLEDWLRDPTFEGGVNLGDGSAPTYDASTGVTTPPPTTAVDSATFTDLDAALAAANAEIDAILPIETTDISDDAITTPKLAANAVTAGKIAADTITANEIAADAITANELAAMNLAVGKYIRSTSFTTGVSGWSIDADGNAEFNNVTVRGAFKTGEEPDARIVIDETLYNNRILLYPDGEEGVDYELSGGLSVDATNGNVGLIAVDWGFGSPAYLTLPSNLGGSPNAILGSPGDVSLSATDDINLDAGLGPGGNAINVYGDLTLWNGGLITPDGVDVLGEWADWTPTLTAASVNPTMFAANRTGRVKKVGRTVICTFHLIWTNLGTGEGTGTGLYTINLPFTAASRPTYSCWGSAGFHHVGVRQYIGYPGLTSATTFIIFLDGGNNYNSALGQINGSFASGVLVYEAAS